jgi:hypothetical protein
MLTYMPAAVDTNRANAYGQFIAYLALVYPKDAALTNAIALKIGIVPHPWGKGVWHSDTEDERLKD